MGRPNGMRGAVALRDIKEGESIIEVPLEGVIRLCDPSQTEDPSVSALELLRMYRKGGGDKPYFDLLPEPGSQDFDTVPDFMTEEEVGMLQCPAAQEKTRRRQEYCKEKAAENGVPLEDLKWAFCTVTMRSFTVVSPMESMLRLLLPGIDLLNHDADSAHKFKVLWTLNPEYDGLFKVVAGRDVKKGDEVTICYGGTPYTGDSGCDGGCVNTDAWTNEQYLQRYGFIDKSVGTTMVDGYWLATKAGETVRKALEATSREEDEALLASGNLAPGAKAAVEFRRHLKLALSAQSATGQEVVEKDTEPHIAPDVVDGLSAAADAKLAADAAVETVEKV